MGRAGVEEMRLELLRPAGGLIVTGSIPLPRAEDQVDSPPPFELSLEPVDVRAALRERSHRA